MRYVQVERVLYECSEECFLTLLETLAKGERFPIRRFARRIGWVYDLTHVYPAAAAAMLENEREEETNFVHPAK